MTNHDYMMTEPPEPPRQLWVEDGRGRIRYRDYPAAWSFIKELRLAVLFNFLPCIIMKSMLDLTLAVCMHPGSGLVGPPQIHEHIHIAGQLIRVDAGFMNFIFASNAIGLLLFIVSAAVLLYRHASDALVFCRILLRYMILMFILGAAVMAFTTAELPFWQSLLAFAITCIIPGGIFMGLSIAALRKSRKALWDIYPDWYSKERLRDLLIPSLCVLGPTLVTVVWVLWSKVACVPSFGDFAAMMP